MQIISREPGTKSNSLTKKTLFTLNIIIIIINMVPRPLYGI